MQKIILKYFNPDMNIALGKWNEAYLIPGKQFAPVQLKPEYYKGALVYRLPGSCKRFSYKKIKARLQRKDTVIFYEAFIMPF